MFSEVLSPLQQELKSRHNKLEQKYNKNMITYSQPVQQLQESPVIKES